VTFITVLGVIGVIHRFIRREYLLPLWMIFPFLLAGRSATGLAVIPLAMLAAVGLGDVLLPALQTSVKGDAEREGQIRPIERNVMLYLILYLVFSAYQFGFQFSSASLNKSDLDAMDWVKMNTAEESRFLVLTGTTSVACDSVSEWFPALADRQSILTIQGYEWTLGNKFGSFITHSVEVQACVEGELSCLGEKTESGDYEYVFLERRSWIDNCAPLNFGRDFKYFFEQMLIDDKYGVVYENGGVVIFDVR